MQRNYTVVCLSSIFVGFVASVVIRGALQPTTANAQEIAPIRNKSSLQTSDAPAPIVTREQLRKRAAQTATQQTTRPTKPASSGAATKSKLPVTIPAENPRPEMQSILRQAMRPQVAQTVTQAAALTPLSDSDANWDGYTPDERANISVYEKANRSVVNITTRTIRPDYFMRAEVSADGTGSGSILDMDGHILTNLHVVEGAREIRVTLHNGQDFEAGIVGQDPVNDIAVLKIAASSDMLTPVTFDDSDRLRVGQKAYAIGNPFGLDRTMTIGIVSSLNRSIPSRNGRAMKSIVQIDAALNQGNSGGPLLNSRGDLIGMNTAIASETGQNTGIGFAIPVSTIRRVVPQLIQDGKVLRPTAGIAHAHPTEAGLMMAALIPGGPAEQAGLQGFRVVREQRQRGAFLYERTIVDRSQADVVQTVDGTAVETLDEMLTVIEQRKPGETVTLGVIRAGEPRSIRVKLGAEE